MHELGTYVTTVSKDKDLILITETEGLQGDTCARYERINSQQR
jgi:hypothetical protein